MGVWKVSFLWVLNEELIVTPVGEDKVWWGSRVKSKQVANGEMILNSAGLGTPSINGVSPGSVLQLICLRFAITILAPKVEIKC